MKQIASVENSESFYDHSTCVFLCPYKIAVKVFLPYWLMQQYPSYSCILQYRRNLWSLGSFFHLHWAIIVMQVFKFWRTPHIFVAAASDASLQQYQRGHAERSFYIMNAAIACVRYCTAVPTVLCPSQVQPGPKVSYSLVLSTGQSTVLNSQTNLQAARMCLFH